MPTRLYLNQRLGNMHTDTSLATQVAHWRIAGTLDETTIDERETRKSRLRLLTSKGRDIGLILPRGAVIGDGDVFTLDQGEGGLLLHLALQEVMVCTPLSYANTTELLAHAVRLGHALGNQHWPVAVVGQQVFVPVSLDRAVMETVLRTYHLTDHFSIHYEQRHWPGGNEPSGIRHE